MLWQSYCDDLLLMSVTITGVRPTSLCLFSVQQEAHVLLVSWSRVSPGSALVHKLRISRVVLVLVWVGRHLHTCGVSHTRSIHACPYFSSSFTLLILNGSKYWSLVRSLKSRKQFYPNASSFRDGNYLDFYCFAKRWEYWFGTLCFIFHFLLYSIAVLIFLGQSINIHLLHFWNTLSTILKFVVRNSRQLNWYLYWFLR